MKDEAMTSPEVTVRLADYRNAADGATLVSLLDHYARDPAGGAHPLSDKAKAGLPAALAERPQAFTVLAFLEGKPVGLINCIEGFSTFACAPLVNVHDVVVLDGYRGLRIGEKMLSEVERISRERGACKLTLEVLSGNAPAMRLYQRIGFAGYALDPAMGTAQFMQKWL